ncbi:MAG: DUF5606 domain-containing protein [Paludibacteraceae bacterium]|nr:DUF5606 domain-containing protein [Paludibacteraceae bacterium]MBQ1851797.1 DUF5606 domain-containing protein [Paludibacteraceae bacterium]MBQ2064464.1 DUF5606 domain-containing protein [Paludibacteraceae bacterium]MBQ5524633.1 DUF5606 domain-containing protein [Paludibacteraceae bacterium]
MLSKILSISGKSGLFKMISGNKNMIIVESLIDKKRFPAYANDRVIALKDISMFTDDEDIPLYKVFESVSKVSDGKAVTIDVKTATGEELKKWFGTVLPTFDRERVHNSDIKKVIQWYNILIGAGITEFAPVEEKEEEKK